MSATTPEHSNFAQVWSVILAKFQMGRHQVASVRHESKLKVSVITVSAIGLWLGAFALFYHGFEWLVSFGNVGGGEFTFGNLIMDRSLGILSLSIFTLLIFSNVLVAFSTLYRSKEVVYLLQGPISYSHFFYARFFECVAFSSWSLAYLGTPLMLAYGITTEASLLFYIAVLFFFLPFIIIPACIGCLITMVLVRIFPRMKVHAMIGLGVLGVGGFFLYIRSIIRSTRVSDETLLPAFLDATATTQSPLLPSYWAAQGVTRAAVLDLGEAGFYFLLLLSNALMLLLVAGWAADRIFYPGWSYLMGQDKQRIKPFNKGILNAGLRLLGSIPNPYRPLIHKDIILFWRDPTQWSQFVLFFGIMAIYIANLRNSSRFYEQEFWRAWVACLNVGAVSLILATLTSRFVFPLVSLEGRRFWILGLAPLSFSQLVWQKFWLSVCTTSAFTVGLAVLSASMLQLDPVYYFMTVYSIVITNFGLAGLAVGLGALYPSFTEDNPARIVSGMGGTLNLLVSIAYITLVVASQTLVLQWNNLGLYNGPVTFSHALTGAIVFITLLSALCVFLPMRLGLKNLNDREF
ncbi:MAG: hypothetical protein HYV27_03610 [Candidatus Hydrogenedentes bacterium]|nr:hypothetical protein [Candidatus Hydrogenedentota bacterium]